ncbi:MAG: TraR/DksA C4-type zinc finger protein [Dehalococcoidales bacterium]|nr:TraR/DksA C4-type zinc finger protein [Dehalococcoidales bacterium]
MANRLEELRKILDAERRRLNDELALAQSGSRDDAQKLHASNKTEDAAAVTTELVFRGAMSQRTREQLVEVERALAKLDEGTYGLCDSCGKRIPPGRLQVIPQTTMCVDCKTKRSRSSARIVR